MPYKPAPPLPRPRRVPQTARAPRRKTARDRTRRNGYQPPPAGRLTHACQSRTVTQTLKNPCPAVLCVPGPHGAFAMSVVHSIAERSSFLIERRGGRLVPQARSPRSAGSGPRVPDEFCTSGWPAQAISPRPPPPPSSATPPEPRCAARPTPARARCGGGVTPRAGGRKRNGGGPVALGAFVMVV